jgi:perosamine synthetase
MAKVPYFRPDLRQEEIDEVAETLRSGWLTTGPRTRRFAQEFAEAVGAQHAVPVNSCTAALHLAVDVLGLRRGDAVLVPSMTFAATAEIVCYLGAHPVLVDCDPRTLSMDLGDAAVKLSELRAGQLPVPADARVVGMIPVHVGGLMMDVRRLKTFAAENGLWLVEDAAHAFPSAWRSNPDEPWQRCGEGTSQVACFSFYANKTITTGEGGMAVTDDDELAAQMRNLSLHGMSSDAWGRYDVKGTWDYRILRPGYKYNMTDVAAALGVHQLARAEEMRQERQRIAETYLERFAGVEELELPPMPNDRVHSWHLFQVRLRHEKLRSHRDDLLTALRVRGIGTSVHWRPLHLHPYYEQLGWHPEQLPVATQVWERILSLPIFPGLTAEEIDTVTETVVDLCRRHRRKG